MFQNTQMAMDQLAEFMQEADQDDMLDMSKDELRAMRELVGYCEQYIRLVEEFDDQRQQLLDALEDVDAMEDF
jgi:ABC-type phosphate/phosphonate transport system ATPase subunit